MTSENKQPKKFTTSPDVGGTVNFLNDKIKIVCFTNSKNNEILLHLDYSENYVNNEQQEIRS